MLLDPMLLWFLSASLQSKGKMVKSILIWVTVCKLEGKCMGLERRASNWALCFFETYKNSIGSGTLVRNWLQWSSCHIKHMWKKYPVTQTISVGSTWNTNLGFPPTASVCCYGGYLSLINLYLWISNGFPWKSKFKKFNFIWTWYSSFQSRWDSLGTVINIWFLQSSISFKILNTMWNEIIMCGALVS